MDACARSIGLQIFCCLVGVHRWECFSPCSYQFVPNSNSADYPLSNSHVARLSRPTMDKLCARKRHRSGTAGSDRAGAGGSRLVFGDVSILKQGGLHHSLLVQALTLVGTTLHSKAPRRMGHASVAWVRSFGRSCVAMASLRCDGEVSSNSSFFLRASRQTTRSVESVENVGAVSRECRLTLYWRVRECAGPGYQAGC